MKKAIIAGIIIVFALIIGAFSFVIVGGKPVEKGNDEQVIFIVAEGDTAPVIAGKLKDADLIRSELAFKIKAKLSGNESKFQAGTYSLNKGMAANRIIWLFANGKTAGKSFRITEGQALYKIAAALEDQEICTQKEFYHEVEKGKFDYPFMKMLPKGAARLEGFLWPDTYSIGLNEGAHEAVDQMLSAFEQNVYNVYKDEIAEKKLDFYKTIVKASIIEREGSFEEDKKKVSSVIDNRLKKDMYLQMDSILSYIHQEDKVIATYGDLKVDSKYNPYKNKGLPPGPICSPGTDSINAAINPDKTNYIFFVNSEKLDGSLTFAETEKEFMKAKEAFEKAYAKYLKENEVKKKD